MSIELLLTISLPLIGAGIGYLIRYNIEKKKELLNEVTKERRILYQQFVDLVITLFGQVKKGKSNDSKFVEELYEFYKKYILYASPKVINSFSDYFQYLYESNKNNNIGADLKIHITKLSKIMHDMRKDLGLSNKGLGENGEALFRAIMSDYDIIMKKQTTSNKGSGL